MTNILHTAVKAGNLNTVKVVLNLNEEDVNSRDNEGNTPLIVASGLGNLAICNYLLENGASARAVNHAGKNALHEAAQGGFVKLCTTLVNAGCHVNACTDSSETPLHFAARCGKLESVKELLRLGANLEAVNSNGHTPLMLALENEKDTVAHFLARHMSITEHVSAPVQHAGASPRVQTSPQAGQAAEQNSVPEPPPSDAQKLLLTSARKGVRSDVSKALRDGAEVNFRYEDQSTALHVAAKHGRKEIVELLLEEDANPRLKDKNEYTALHLAVLKNHLDVVKILVGHDPSLIHIKNGQGKTAYDLAVIDKDSDIEKYLREIR